MVNISRFVPTPLPPTSEGFRLLFVGLLDTDQKGLHVLLDALVEIKRSGSIRLQVAIVGDGALRRQYQAQAQHSGIGDLVSFHGLQPNEVVAQMLRDSHALVLPSLHESQGVVVLEAMASGRPVVATRSGGPEYLLNDSTGLVVEPRDPAALASGISDLLGQLDSYDPDAIAREARLHYSEDAVAKRLSAIYSELIRRRGR
jgi:glycosyltransferase involved in cell wall biosynthesis